MPESDNTRRFNGQWKQDVEGYREGARYMDASDFFDMVEARLEGESIQTRREKDVRGFDDMETFEELIEPPRSALLESPNPRSAPRRNPPRRHYNRR